MKNLKLALLATAAASLTIGASAMAHDKNNRTAADATHYQIEDVNVKTYNNGVMDTFAEADRNNDGIIVFDEFQIFAQLDNEYERFLVLDQNRNKELSKDEFYSLDEAQNNYVQE